MSPEQRLWQTVVLKAVVDGLSPRSVEGAERLERIRADDWIRGDSPDFRKVCDLSGINSDFIRGAYVSGRIDLTAIQSWEKFIKAAA